MEYRTLSAVELVSVGMQWRASSGDIDVTFEHLADMVAASEDPHILAPRLKLGHADTRFNSGTNHDPFNQDGAPALGKATNLRLTNDGATLVGDFVEVPAWLADAAPSAYPSRSAEWVFSVTTPGDRHYSAVLTAVALLGPVMPAVQDLDDLERLLTDGPADLVAAAVAPEGGTPVTPQPAASIDVGTIRQRFNFEWAASDPIDGEDTYWWWCRSIRLAPNEVIADDDEGGLWSIPFTTDGEDAVTFGEPQRVRETFVPIAASATARLSAFTSRADQQVAAAALERPDKPTKATASARPSTLEDRMDPAEIRRNLGLAEDASDDEVTAAFAAARGEEPEGDGEQEPPADPPAVDESAPAAAGDGTVVLDQEAYAQLRTDAQAGAEARRLQIGADRDREVEAAIASGRIPPARREHWRRALDADQEGASASLASLEPGLVPVGKETGVGASAGEGETGPENFNHLFPQLSAAGAKEA